MRLTLRTLLAYLDDILEPEDAEDISRRVQESEVASALMHRIRDVMRRLRLEAPLVEETGKDLDPNTVAEYLDHILPDERVPDFERICLESDMHLAEVASCHQILALVLGEPAEVDPASREHMYALPQVASELQAMEVRAAQEPVLDESILVGVEPPPTPRRLRPVVPDYLREPRRRRHPFPWIVAAVLLVGLIVVGYLAADYFSRFGGQPLTQVAQKEQEQPTTASTAPPGDSQATVPPLTLPVQPTLDQTPPSAPVVGPETVQPAATGEPGQSGTPVDAPPAEVQPVGPGGALPPTPVLPQPVEPPPSGPVAPGQVQPTAPGQVDRPEPGQVQPTAPAATEQPAPAQVQPGVPPASIPQPGQAASADARPIQSLLPPNPTPPAHGPAMPQPQQPPVGPTVELAAPAQAVEPVRVGRFVSDVSENQVLLQWDSQARAWSRVPPQGAILSGHDLLALPAARPLIELTAGLTVQLRSGTRIGVEAAEEKEVPRVTLEFGRTVVSATGKPDARLLLTVGGQSGVLVFVDPESRAAIDVIRSFVPGVDPEKEAAEPVAQVYALSGRLIWEADNGTPKVEIKTSSRITLGSPVAPVAEPVDGFPTWIVSSSTDSLDRLAFKAIEEGISVDRPVTLGLREKLDHRKKEVKWLATRCLGYVGDFGPLVAALDKPDQKSVWIDYLDQLHEALARGPETAANVRAALQRAYGADGAEVYRMLWGYTPDQLLAGQDAELVNALGSDLLAARVVSFWNLRTLTGLSLYYRPEDTAAKRQQRIRAWEKRQESGDLPRLAAARAQRAAGQAVPEKGPPPAEPAPSAAPSPAPTLP